MKKIFLRGRLLLITAIFLSCNTSSKQTEVEKIRIKHKEFLKTHPFANKMNLSKKQRKAQGLPPNAFFEQKYLSEINPRTGETNKQNVFKIQEELTSNRFAKKVPGDVDNEWVERGPNNVGGRTRAILFDPNDNTSETVFAGGVSGGLWKNTNISNADSQWVRVGISENLAVSCITVDPNNSQIFYLGTGESYVNGDVNGNGVWKSTDGGNSWLHVFGGVTGETYFDTNALMTINTPTALLGDYPAIMTAFFGSIIDNDITQDLILVNDGIDITYNACEEITNTDEINGKIAVIRRGSCNFDDKVLRAENAGAIAVIMVNNISGDPIPMGGDDTTITIPSVMIAKEIGETIIDKLSTASVNVTLSSNEGATGYNTVPGIQHINDIVVRDNNGVSEVYIAAGESPYSTSTPSAILGSDSYGVYKSTDGEVFSKLSIPKTTDGNEYEPNNLEVAIDNTILLSTNESRSFGDGGGVIFRSDADGTSFTNLYTVPDGLRTEIEVSPINANTVYVLAEIDSDTNPVKIYKTTDNFINITEQALPNDADSGISEEDFTKGQAYYNLLLKIDPNDEDTLFAGGIDLFKSTDTTTAWDQLSHWYGSFGISNNVHADQHGIAFANGSSTKMVFSNDGGVYFSNDGGKTIEARNNNYNTLQFYTVAVASTTAFEGDYFIAGAQDNGNQIFEEAIEDIDSSVEEAFGGDGAYCFFDTDGDDKYYVVNYVYNQNIRLYDYKTGITTTINDEDLLNGDFINQQELDTNLNILYANYSSTSGNIIKRYSDLTSGSIQKDNLTNSLMSANPSALKISPYTTDSSKLLVGLKDGTLLKIEEANETNQVWTDLTGAEFLGSISDIEFGNNEDEIFVTMHNYGVVSIWYTNDAGVTWNNKEGDFSDIPVKAILQNPLNTEEVIIGTDLGVWKTTDFSTSSPNWEQAYNGMSNVPVLDLDLRDDNTVFAATYGRGVFSGLFTGEIANIKETSVIDLKGFEVYPSISNGAFTVFTKNITGKTKMSIINTNGQVVYKSNLDFNSTEEHKISINVNAGIYIVNLIEENGEKVSKKIIIK